MKINKVERVQNSDLGMDGLHIKYEDDSGKVIHGCYVDAKDALTKVNGEEKFIHDIRADIEREKKSIKTKDPTIITDLPEHKDRKI